METENVNFKIQTNLLLKKNIEKITESVNILSHG